MRPTLHVKPSAPYGERWGVTFGAWNDPDQVTLQGFATAHDAWAFTMATTMEDASDDQRRHKVSREWTYNPEEVKPEQIKMFTETP